MDPHDTPAKRLDAALREIRALTLRKRQGALAPDEYRATVAALLRDARLDQPNLSRPWWADDLCWLMRSIAQGVHSNVLRDGEHVATLRGKTTRFRQAPLPGFRHASLDECSHLAVHLESALPAVARFGFSLPRADVDRALVLASDTRPGLVVGTRMQVYFHGVRGRRRVVVLDWAQVQALGASPRRGDPRGL
ncbi:MAG: hypothetical protein HYZ28_21110 [Myxococcales bacterium]|nr:hypothetical protein [Myxococcales bacterium]